MGKTATFLLEGRQANMDFARAAAKILSQAGETCHVLDLDAFYYSNATAIFKALPSGFLKSTTIRVPEPGSDIEREFAGLFESEQKVIVVDSLNTLYHLTSQDDGSSRTRKLTFSVAALSYFARANQKAVILSMYRREGFAHSATGRPISNVSDITASVGVTGEEMTVTCERGTAWPGGAYSTRIP